MTLCMGIGIGTNIIMDTNSMGALGGSLRDGGVGASKSNAETAIVAEVSFVRCVFRRLGIIIITMVWPRAILGQHLRNAFVSMPTFMF